jgi:hypothetical protein
VFILDENSKEADALIDKAKTAMNANQGEIEHNLTEAIAAFNAGEYDRSRPLLERVLQSFPGHREAQYYLGRINDRPVAAPPTATAIVAIPSPTFSALHIHCGKGGNSRLPAAPFRPPLLQRGQSGRFDLGELNLPTGGNTAGPAASVGQIRCAGNDLRLQPACDLEPSTG